MSASETVEYVFVSSDDDQALSVAQDYAERFVTSYGPDARAVSFCEATRTKFPSDSRVSFWRDVLTREENEKFHADSLRYLESFGSWLNGDLLPMFSGYRRELYCEMLMLSVLVRLQREPRPLCLILSGRPPFGPVTSIRVCKLQGDVPRRLAEAACEHAKISGDPSRPAPSTCKALPAPLLG